MTRMLAVVAAIAVALPIAPFAHEGASGMVKARMDGMKSIAAATKTLGEMAKSGFIQVHAAEEAATLLAEEAAAIPDHFRMKAMDPPTEAVPAIWEKWDDFTALARDMEAAAIALGTATGDPDGFQAAFAQLGRSCRSCHESYRLER